MVDIRKVGSGELRVGCSFCGKVIPDVDALVAARTDAVICDECFSMAFEVFMKQSVDRSSRIRKYRVLLKRELGWDDAEIDRRLAEVTGQ